MASTQALKTLIEAELAAGFLKQHDAVEIRPGRLLGIDFDLVAYSAVEKILWVCEMTASGFLGGSKGDFHVGASRKFCEGFAKFSILRLKAHEAKERVSAVCDNPAILSTSLQCRFVVPLGCRFIRALGWRRQLVEGVMELHETELSRSSHETMVGVLRAARNEQRKGEIATLNATISK